MTTPTPVHGYQCPTCKTIITVTLGNDQYLTGPVEVVLHSGQGVMWCANGHVTVFDKGQSGMVYDFTGADELEPDENCTGSSP